MAFYYWDKETRKIVEGFPPNPNPRYGDAPMVIFDSMPKSYHEGACRYIESRKEWEQADKEHDNITFSSMSKAKPKVDTFYEESKRKSEYRKASQTALQAYKDNPKEVEQKLQKRAEEQIKALEEAGLLGDKIKKDDES